MFEELQLSPTLLVWLSLAAIPLLVATCTAFTKVSVVLSALRIGLGGEQLLPWSAIFSLSIVLTAVIMAPVAFSTLEIVDSLGGIDALMQTPGKQWLSALLPWQEFLQSHASNDEIAFFAEFHQLPLTHPLVLIPAFLVTELMEAVHMALLLLLPFMAVDLIVAQILVLLGIGSQPQQLVTLPLKLALFLAAGGWDVVILGLFSGY